MNARPVTQLVPSLTLAAAVDAEIEKGQVDPAEIAARRELGKRFLRDLWVEARRQQGLSTTAKRGKRGGVKHRPAGSAA